MREKPRFAGTMMGAVPYRDMDRAAGTILECFPEAPCLPIMTRGIRWMLEGIPCLVFDRGRRIVYFDLSTEREGEILDFYDRIEADDNGVIGRMNKGLRIEAECFNRSIHDPATMEGLRQFVQRDHPDRRRDQRPRTPGLVRDEVLDKDTV